MKKVVSIVLSVMMVLVLFAGCSAKGTEATTDAQTSEATESADAAVAAPETADSAATQDSATDLTAGDLSGLRIGFEYQAPHPYYSAVLEGVYAFEEDFGVEVDIQSGTDFTQSTQNGIVEAMAAKGLAGISIVPSDAAGANALYKELTDQGIFVISYGASTDLPTTASFAVATDIYQAAYDACDYLIQQMGEKGNILNILEVLSDPNTAKRQQAVEDCVATYPDVQIIQTIGDIQSVEAANEKIESALAANAGEIDGMICTGSTTTQGMAEVLTNYYKQYGTDKKFYAIGIDTDAETLTAIQDGVISATIAQNTYAAGYVPLVLLKLMIVDGYVPATDQYFVDGKYVVVTADNLDTYNDDLSAVTQEILDTLTTVYLTKAN